MTGEKRIKAGGILKGRDLCLIGVMSAPDRPGLAAAVFQLLGREHLNAQFIVQSIDLNNESHILFCIASEDCARVLSLLEPLAMELGAEKVSHCGPVAILSVFGPDFRERPGISGVVFGALARVGINILAISTSISTLSCVIDDSRYEQALESLRSVLDWA